MKDFWLVLASGIAFIGSGIVLLEDIQMAVYLALISIALNLWRIADTLYDALKDD